jgi:hypothetical protein
MADEDQMNGALHLPKFEDRLWDELAAAHAAEAATRPASGRGPGRTRLLVAAAVLALGAVVGAAAVMAARDDADQVNVAAQGEDEGTSDDAQGVPVEVDEDWEPMIVVVHQENSFGGDDRRWEDEGGAGFRSLQLDDAGEPSYDSAWLDLVEREGGELVVVQRTVDHRNQTWYDDEWAGPTSGEGTDHLTDPVSPRQSHEDAVAAGFAVEDGLEVVDGVELLRVVDAMPGDWCGTNPLGDEVCLDLFVVESEPDSWACPPDGWILPEGATGDGLPSRSQADDGSDGDFVERQPDPEVCVPPEELVLQGAEADPSLGVTWLDPETYRPVLRHGYPGSDAEYTQTFEYLERTEENLALLDPEIPEGYTQIDPADAAGDAEFADEN